MILLPKRKIVQISVCVLALVGIGVSTPFAVVASRTNKMKDDISLIKENDKYLKKVEVTGVEAIESSENSSDYAVIEMISNWKDDEVNVTNESETKRTSLFKLSTDEFAKELKKQTNTEVKTYEYLTNSSLIDTAYESLNAGNPVALEWARKNGEEWVLDYSLMTAIDIVNDSATVYNASGYFENISLDELIQRTSFEVVENMSFGLQLSFAYGGFTKNTVFVLD